VAPRLKAPPQVVPQTLDEAQLLAADIGASLREIDVIEIALAAEIVKLKLSAKHNTAPIATIVKAKFNALASFAQAHRDDILPPDRKSLAIAAGVIGWRKSNPTVEIEADMEEAIIAFLREHDGEHFLVETVAISKTALLADREFAATVPHISINQVEQFYFKPLDIDQEQTRNLGKAPAEREVA
jgi:phage host-nuclease inhibitor protein Gam